MNILAYADPNTAIGDPAQNAGEWVTKFYNIIIDNGLNILAAIVILIIGRIVAKYIKKLVKKACTKANLEPTLISFLGNLVYISLLVFVIIAALAQIGFQTASFIAVIGAAGLAVGLALSGTLSNFAAGVLMMIFKPFKIGDFVEIAGTKGTITEIQIFNTIMNSPDNIKIIVPNSQAIGGCIKNYSANGTRRVDLTVGVSYGDDLGKAKQVIEAVLKADERVLAEPAITVAVVEMADSSVNFVVRPWVKSADYWGVYFDLTEKIKIALDDNNITIPFPQRDVHMINDAAK